MVILDLEWNRGYDQKPLEELLQIGAVKVDRPGGPILDTFNVFIHPTVHKRFDIGARRLPELAASRSSRIAFPQAFEDFRAWCAGETEFAAWGRDDLQTLEQNCAYWSLPPLDIRKARDLQQSFAYFLGAEGTQIALWRAADYLGIPDVFDFHNALYDAVYTAVVAGYLTEEALRYTPPPALPKGRKTSFSPLAFPPQPRRRVGPLPEKEDVFNAREARRAVCPLCGKPLWVQRWWPSDGEIYYSPIRCREHGRFLCRLTLARGEDGLWRGRRSVPALTEELRRLYQVLKSGKSYQCRPLGRQKRRRYSRAK